MRARWPLLLLGALPGVLLAQGPQPSRVDLAFHVTSVGSWESNLDHEQAGREAYGGVMAVGIGFRDRAARPRLVASYEAALHRYTVPSPYDRVSHQGELGIALRPARWLVLESGGEIALRGSSEDRDLSDTYQAAQEIGIRFARAVRLTVEGAIRQRRYPDAVGRDGTGRYLEAELSQRVMGDGWLTLGGKFEVNRADSLRYRYRRQTWSLELETSDAAATWLAVELKYRIQRYTHRRVELEVGRTPLRRDFRLTPSITVTHRFGSGFEVALGYEFENRTSNDASKGYSAHQTSFSVTRRW